MLEWLITSKTRRKLLGFFASNPGASLYLCELSEALKESPQSVRAGLEGLLKAGFIFATGKGKEKKYQLNEGYILFDEIRTIFKKIKDAGKQEFDFTNLSRKKLIQENLDNVVSTLVSKYEPEKIILFGSFANGVVTDTTDIDIAIVKKTNKPYYDRIRDVVSLCKYNVGIDFLIYNPVEFSNMQKNSSFVREEIVKKGKVLYDKAA